MSHSSHKTAGFQRTLLVTLFTLVLLAMVIGTSTASLQESILAIPAAVWKDPWFQATLLDAYFGFLTFYAWVFYRSPQWPARIGWLVAILLLGNMAMASYALYRLWRWPKPYSASQLLLRSDAH